jgi:3-oxoacyl-[acyl-carrier protein] reductase
MSGVKDRVAIVTGGSRGIGQAIAELFAENGAKVIIWDLLDEGHDVAENINKNGGTAKFVKLSVTDKEGIQTAVNSAVEKYGKIDILINNAGITRDKSMLKMSDDEWNAVIDVNLNSIYYCCKAVAPVMKENGYGRIISASSTTGLRGNYGQVNYAATKAGILGMTKTLAVELGRYGITVNAIAPGYTQTPMTDAIPDNIKALAKTQIPVGFLAEPRDLAFGYLFLASEEARFVSGIVLPIDGGVTR